jgi:hypothetical protein
VYINLAPWHTFKVVVQRLYKYMGDEVFAHVFHSIFPDQNFKPKPKKFSACIAILQYLRKSYPRWRTRLTEICTTPGRMYPQYRAQARRLRTLMEFCIPAVRISRLYLST